jgi:hypothetical protein
MKKYLMICFLIVGNCMGMDDGKTPSISGGTIFGSPTIIQLPQHVDGSFSVKGPLVGYSPLMVVGAFVAGAALGYFVSQAQNNVAHNLQ